MQNLSFSPLRTSCRTCTSVPGRIRFAFGFSVCIEQGLDLGFDSRLTIETAGRVIKAPSTMWGQFQRCSTSAWSGVYSRLEWMRLWPMMLPLKNLGFTGILRVPPDVDQRGHTLTGISNATLQHSDFALNDFRRLAGSLGDELCPALHRAGAARRVGRTCEIALYVTLRYPAISSVRSIRSPFKGTPVPNYRCDRTRRAKNGKAQRPQAP